MAKTTWRFQHEDGSIVPGYETDARGLELRRQCGYGWVNRNDGAGWRQIQFAIRDARFRELAFAVGAAS